MMFIRLYHFLHMLFVLHAMLIDYVIMVECLHNNCIIMPILESDIEQLSESILMLEALVENVEHRVRFQVLADVLEEHAVLFGGGEVTGTFTDELGELGGDSTTEVGIVGQFFNGLGLKEGAHGDDSADEFICVDFALACQFAHPEVLLTQVVVHAHPHILQASLSNIVFLLFNHLLLTRHRAV